MPLSMAAENIEIEDRRQPDLHIVQPTTQAEYALVTIQAQAESEDLIKRLGVDRKSNEALKKAFLMGYVTNEVRVGELEQKEAWSRQRRHAETSTDLGNYKSVPSVIHTD